jgi:hypothetical protein
MKCIFTEQEDALIKKIPEKHLGNLSKGFRELGEQLGRSPQSISSRYYYLKKKDKNQGNYSFMVISNKQLIGDRKIVRENCPIRPIKSKRTWLKNILDRLFGKKDK